MKIVLEIRQNPLREFFKSLPLAVNELEMRVADLSPSTVGWAQNILFAEFPYESDEQFLLLTSHLRKITHILATDFQIDLPFCKIMLEYDVLPIEKS